MLTIVIFALRAIIYLLITLSALIVTLIPKTLSAKNALHPLWKKEQRLFAKVVLKDSISILKQRLVEPVNKSLRFQIVLNVMCKAGDVSPVEKDFIYQRISMETKSVSAKDAMINLNFAVSAFKVDAGNVWKMLPSLIAEIGVPRAKIHGSI